MRGLLEKVPGVTDVEISIPGKTATVKVEAGTDAATLAATINASKDYSAKIRP